jgi:hypothetical protein
LAFQLDSNRHWVRGCASRMSLEIRRSRAEIGPVLIGLEPEHIGFNFRSQINHFHRKMENTRRISIPVVTVASLIPKLRFICLLDSTDVPEYNLNLSTPRRSGLRRGRLETLNNRPRWWCSQPRGRHISRVRAWLNLLEPLWYCRGVLGVGTEFIFLSQRVQLHLLHMGFLVLSNEYFVIHPNRVPSRLIDDNNTTFTWSGPRGVGGCTGQAR